jgi:hypothetical protein
MKTNPAKKDTQTPASENTPGYPVYPSGEDIYNKEKAEPYIESEESPLDLDLDVPGSELDDADELIGEEDEENNYYSLRDGDYDDPDENNSEK